MGKFNSYFDVWKNVIYKRARFNHRVKKESESVEQYITELKLVRDTPNWSYADFGKNQNIDKTKAAVKITDISFCYTRWAMKLLTLVYLEAISLIRTDLIINLNIPLSDKDKKGLQCTCGHDNNLQETNIHRLVQFVTMW